jgi:hypothetical protein
MSGGPRSPSGASAGSAGRRAAGRAPACGRAAPAWPRGQVDARGRGPGPGWPGRAAWRRSAGGAAAPRRRGRRACARSTRRPSAACPAGPAPRRGRSGPATAAGESGAFSRRSRNTTAARSLSFWRSMTWPATRRLASSAALRLLLAPRPSRGRSRLLGGGVARRRARSGGMSTRARSGGSSACGAVSCRARFSASMAVPRDRLTCPRGQGRRRGEQRRGRARARMGAEAACGYLPFMPVWLAVGAPLASMATVCHSTAGRSFISVVRLPRS